MLAIVLWVLPSELDRHLARVCTFALAGDERLERSGIQFADVRHLFAAQTAKPFKQDLVRLLSGHVRVVHEERPPKHQRDHGHALGLKLIDVQASLLRFHYGLAAEL